MTISKKSFTCILSFCLFLFLFSIAPTAFGKSRSTEPRTSVSVIRQPEGYSSDGQHLVVRSTDAATTMYATPAPRRATEPKTTVSIIRQPEGYSSDGQHLVVRSTEPVTTTYAILPSTRRPTEPKTFRTRTW